MSDLDLNKLTSLACIQKKFPNDDLKLFDATTPSLNDKKESPQSYRNETTSVDAACDLTSKKSGSVTMQRKSKPDMTNTTAPVEFFLHDDPNTTMVMNNYDVYTVFLFYLTAGFQETL